MGRKPNNSNTAAIVSVTSLLDMLPEQMKEAIRKLTPAKIAKLRAEVQSKLDQAQYLSNMIDGVLKESSPEYYAAITQQPKNVNVPSWQNNTGGVGIHPMSMVPPITDTGRGYTFDGDPLPLNTIVETQAEYSING
jgi:hypothetical protein